MCCPFFSSVSPHARKAVAGRYAARHAAALAKLEASGKFKVVTVEMIAREMTRDAAHRIHTAGMARCRARHFRLWAGEVMAARRAAEDAVVRHYNETILVKCLAGWVIFTRRRLDPTDGVRRAARRTTRFATAHNERLVTGHFRVVHLGKHLRAWRALHAKRVEVDRRFHRVADTLAARALAAWRGAARYQAGLKGSVVGQWKEYTLRLLLVPFRAWYVYASRRKARHRAQAQLVFAYRHRKQRILTYTVFKMWRHQAIYGKVEGYEPPLLPARRLSLPRC